jgi:hypothetical protein
VLDKQQEASDNLKENVEKGVQDVIAKFNQGKITFPKLVAEINALLRTTNPQYKATGDILGEAFTSGFQAQINALVAQAKQLPERLRSAFGGAGNSPNVIDVRATITDAREQREEARQQLLTAQRDYQKTIADEASTMRSVLEDILAAIGGRSVGASKNSPRVNGDSPADRSTINVGSAAFTGAFLGVGG